MTRAGRSLEVAVVILAAAGVVVAGCSSEGGSDDDGTTGNGSGTGGGYTGTYTGEPPAGFADPNVLAVCVQHCTAQITAGCMEGLTVADCDPSCTTVLSRVSVNCQMAYQASYQCQLMQPNVCDPAILNEGCEPQLDAATACHPTG